jgi:hypothetical protein
MDIDLVLAALSKLTNSPPPALLFIGLIALGYVFKIIPSFQNKWIPRVNLLVAIVLYPLICKSDLAETYSMRFPWIGALVRDEIVAMVVFCASWLMHRVVLKRFVDKFLPNSTNGNGDTKFFRTDEIITTPIPLTPPDKKD